MAHSLQQARLALPANSYWQDFNLTPTSIRLNAEVETEAQLNQWLRQWLEHDHLHINQQNQQPSHLHPGQLQVALSLSTLG